MAPTPTPEQIAIIDAYKTGKDLVIEAGAGCGKTSVLKMAAATTPGRRGLYIAYNKAIQVEAEKSFPKDVTCKTAHALAYGSVGRLYARRLRQPRMRAENVAKILRINEPLHVSDNFITPTHLARIVMSTVTKFTHSAHWDISYQRVPYIPGYDRDTMDTLNEVIPPLAVKAWEDICRADGKLPFSHDCYLKIWALSRPQLPYEYILLDEAQDSNPPVAAIVEGQRNAQKILVGDSSQSIYGWRGAQDAMSKFDGTRLTLSQSFRFGKAVADEANKWLDYLDAPLRLSGFEQITSRVEERRAAGRTAPPDHPLRQLRLLEGPGPSRHAGREEHGHPAPRQAA